MKSYIALIAALLIPILAIQEGEIWGWAFYIDDNLKGFLTGALIACFFYVSVLYTLGPQKSLPFDRKWIGAFFHLLPVLLIAVLARLTFPDVMQPAFQIVIGLVAVFFIGGSFLVIREYRGPSATPNLFENPFEIAFRFVAQQNSERIPYPEESGLPVQIECSASEPITVALLTANDRGRPHCRHPLLKANSEKDVLYENGEPFQITPPEKGKAFKLWIIGSPDRDQLIEFIGQNRAEWPSEQSSAYKKL